MPVKYSKGYKALNTKKTNKSIIILVLIVAASIGLLVPDPYQGELPEAVTTGEVKAKELTITSMVTIAEPYKAVRAHITGYNTVPGQTDSTPCIAASGDNICGRTDVVACPRKYPLGTKVQIDGKVYVCLDRLAAKYDNRFDISCDKDMQCPYEVTGYKEVIIK